MAQLLNLKKNKILILSISSIFLIILIILGTSNSQDPQWMELDRLLAKKDFQLVQDRAFDLQKLFKEIQRDENIKRESSLKLISEPFLPLWEYDKFIKYLNYALKNRFMIISGVTGAGKTTLADRIARFISASPDRELIISCVPKFEVEYHNIYIGRQDGTAFKKGKLISFFEQCFRDPLHNYVLIMDDIDKINPESFFGAAIWGEFDNPGYDHPIDNYTKDIRIPPNFYMISITHSGVSSVIEFNDEHLRRLGNISFIAPDYTELYLYLKEKTAKEQISTGHLKKLVYFFIKANEFIENKYSRGHTLGQWSTLKKYFRPKDFNKFIQTFIDHVNAFKPGNLLRVKDFDDIVYALNNDGLMPGTNIFSRILDFFIKYGLFSEFSVGLIFIITSGLFGWIIFLRRRSYIKNITDRVYNAVNRFNHNQITYDEVQMEITDLKREVDNLIFKRKINYNEATFFYFLIEDSFKSIDTIQKTHDLSEEFLNMLNDFLQDGVLDDKEYRSLDRFLEKFKLQISRDDYLLLRKRLDDLHYKKI